jgi:hypothetical protein
MRMRKLGRMIRRRYLTASVFLAAFLAVTAIDQVLPSRDRQALAAWASTSVANLEHHPVASLVLSAFIAGGSAAIWPVLIALALFGANRALGSVRAAVIFAAAHVIGTLVSEGIVAYRVDAGVLPVSSRHLLDVGPSYVVVAAAVVALASGSMPARGAAALDLAVLIIAGRIFAGLSSLDVAAVGHVTAMAVAACAVLLLRVRAARRARRTAADPPSPPRDPGAASSALA